MRDEKPPVGPPARAAGRRDEGARATVRRLGPGRSAPLGGDAASPAPRLPVVLDIPVVRTSRVDGSIDLAESITVIAAGDDPGHRADIWHPGLPDGAVDLLREELDAGRPACVYVEPPIGGGRSTLALSVLVRVGSAPTDAVSVELVPRVPDAAGTHLGLTRDAFAVEVQARVEGTTRADAAALGRESLRSASAVHQGGLLGLAARALTEEVAARQETATTLYVRTPASGATDDVLRELAALEGDISALLLQLRPVLGLADDMDAARERALPDVIRLEATARAAAEPVPGLWGAIAAEVERARPHVSGRAEQARARIDGLEAEARALRTLGDAMRLRAAVVRLHAMTAAAAVVAADQSDPIGPEVGVLGRALRADLDGLAADLDALHGVLAEAARRVGAVVAEIDRVRVPLQGWAEAMRRAGRPEAAAVPARLGGMVELASLAERCRRTTIEHDIDASTARLEPLELVAAMVCQPHAC